MGPVDQLTELAARRLERLVPELMRDEPVVVLAGARTVGKSTLLRRLADLSGATILDLDDVGTRALVRDDLAFYARGGSPVLVDEFQHVPELLDAIKAEINLDARPGRFLLTGSTRYSALPRAAQSLTGRVHVVTVWPLSQGEIAGRREDFVERLLADAAALVDRQVSGTSRAEYAERALAGGLPAVLRRRAGRPRTRWYEDYVALVIARDALDIRDIRQSDVLPRFLAGLAAQTGQVLNVAAASRAAGVAPSVGEDYTRLLEAVFLVHRLPAWGTTLSARANRLPKLHVVDSGLGGWLLGINVAGVLSRNPAVMTEFGHLLESFVVNEILKQASWLDRGLTIGHYRTSDGIEVDLVIEDEQGGVYAVEVKAGGTYRREDLRGLSSMRTRLGDRFRAGVLLYSGDRAATVDDRLFLAPIDSLWRGLDAGQRGCGDAVG